MELSQVQIISADPELSDNLQYVSLITITNEECKNVYGFQVSDDMICATGNYIEGTCLVSCVLTSRYCKYNVDMIISRETQEVL
jgi:hypothetical protein